MERGEGRVEREPAGGIMRGIFLLFASATSLATAGGTNDEEGEGVIDLVGPWR